MGRNLAVFAVLLTACAHTDQQQALSALQLADRTTRALHSTLIRVDESRMREIANTAISVRDAEARRAIHERTVLPAYQAITACYVAIATASAAIAAGQSADLADVARVVDSMRAAVRDAGVFYE